MGGWSGAGSLNVLLLHFRKVATLSLVLTVAELSQTLLGP